MTSQDGGYGAARQAAAFVDLEERGVLEATGPLRQKFLQGMLSNDVARLQSEPLRLLHPDGHLVAIAEPRGGGDSRHFLHPGVVLE